MKILQIISFFVLLVAVSCTNISGKKNPIKELGVTKPDDCALYMLNYNYSALDLSFSFDLNENFDVVKTYKKVNGEIERMSSFQYDDNGRVVGGNVFIADTLVGKIKIDWLNDSIIFHTNNNYDGSWNNSNNMHIALNKNKEFEMVLDSYKDSLGNENSFGTGYKAEWENGNMLVLRNWVLKRDSLGYQIEAEDYMKQNAALLKGKAFVFDNRVFYDKVEIEKFYDASYEYDDKNNPFRSLSLAEVILPSEFNTSVNNPLKTVKTYATGEVFTFTYSYEYNENDYPVKAEVVVTYTAEGEEIITKEYSIDFVYKNCD